MIKPNIYIIGVQKASTTSLYDFLRTHPEIYGPSIKDYNNSHPFFTDESYFENKKGDFERLFRENEVCPRVITSEVELFEKKEYLERIKKYNPDSKIILSLRNPVERTKSMFRYYKQIGRASKETTFSEVLEEQRDIYVERSLYYEKTKNLFEVFEKEKVHIVYFEDLVGDNFNQSMAGLFEFLGVEQMDMDYVHENKTGQVKYRFLDNLLKLGQGTKTRDFLVQEVLDKILDANQRYRIKKKFFKLNHKKTEKDREVLSLPESIKNLFREDVQKLGKLIDKNLLDFWGLK